MLMQRDKDILRFIEEYKSITIYQCHRIFFNSKYGYDHARKRLQILKNQGLLKTGKNFSTNEMIYYDEKLLSTHELFLNDFYSFLICNGAKVLEYKKEPIYKNIRPDAFFKFEYNGIVKGVIVEIDFTHKTVLKKYEPFFEGYFEEKYGGNPLVCIVTENSARHPAKFDVCYLNFKFDNFVLEILS